MKRLATLITLLCLLTANAFAQSKQFLEVVIQPKTATLEINGEVKQTKNGIYRELVPLGKHQCKVYQDGYYTDSREIEITDPFNTYSASVHLKMIKGYLTIKEYRIESEEGQKNNWWDSSWEGYIDDEYVGKLPIYSVLKCGSHNLTLKHPHFETYDTTFDITENNVTILTPTLVRSAVSMSLRASSSNSDIYIDDEYKAKGRWNGTFTIGQTYKFEAKKPGMASEPQFYTITNEDHSRTYYLPEPRPLFGSILVSSNIPNSDICVYLDDKGPYQTSDLGKIAVGEHKIYVVANKDNPYNYYKSEVKIVTVHADQETTVTFDIPLVPMSIVSNIPYTEIRVDNDIINSENPYVKLGEHRVTIIYQEGFFNERHFATETINIEEGANNEVVFNIDHGSLIITSNSSTYNIPVFCENREFFYEDKRMTPIYIPVIKPGKYTFIGFFDDMTKLSHFQTKTVEISQGEIAELDFHKGYGSLKITSDPDSARVSVPRVRYGGSGLTPFEHSEIMIGEYNVEVIYPNGQYSQKRITISENELTEYKFIASEDDPLYAAISLDNIEEEIEDIPIVIEDIIINTEDDEDFEITIMDYQEKVVEEAIPFQLVEEKPSFQGGDANKFSKWVNQRLVYPEITWKNGVQGRVTLQFTVEKDGSITNVKVLRGVDPALDKEAIRVVSSSPKWTPGKQRERAVPVTYTFPVIFQLR